MEVNTPGSDKFRIADRSGTYDLGKGRILKIDASGVEAQWFEIRWPESGDWKKSHLWIPILMSEAEAGKFRMQPRIQFAIVEPTIGWRIVWEENLDEVCFESSQQPAVVTRLTTANPAQVTATHYYRSMTPPFIESRDVSTMLPSIAQTQNSATLKCVSPVVCQA